MPPAAKKRKTGPAPSTRTTRASASKAAVDDAPQDTESVEETHDGEANTRAEDATGKAAEEVAQPTTSTPEDAPNPAPAPAPTSSEGGDVVTKAQDRMARFKALQARAKSSSDQNFKEATRESQRLASDPSQLNALQRKQAIASHKLLKADVEDEGGDFERKRAWDWTIDESEKWDKRVKKKEAHRDNNAFQSYQAESNKIYKRQLKNMEPDFEGYEKSKKAAIEKAAASGGLEIVETEDGELIAVDKDGSFYSTADSMASFGDNKPTKENVDRLVADLRRAEENRLKKRKDRMAKNGDDGDVTYINEKNKQFNQKLARFYNKYTAEIRDSFERGTMI